jgi:putative ABC transport system permease protein
VRNPRRTTSATIALVIGVALVTMMSVGAESLKATLLNEVDGSAPWDLDVHQSGEASNPAAFADLVQSASRLDGVAASARMRALDAEIQGAGEQDTVAFPANIVDPDALASIWRDPRSIDGFGPGTALVPDWLSGLAGIEDGETFTIAFGSTEVELEARVTTRFENLVMAEQDLANLSVSPTLDSLWIRLADDTDRDDVKHDLYDLADERGITIFVGGLGGYRETLTSALDQMVFVITALLGVAVLIAIIGVGNTLSLSVIERTRESALLRALGFTKTQLRQSLAVEAVLLSLIGCLIGIVLGVAFGWIGAITVIGDTWPIALGFPLARIGLIVAVAVICGLLASILPARRAAQADPIVALAEV